MSDVVFCENMVANVVCRSDRFDRPLDRNADGAIPSGSGQETLIMPVACGPMDLPCARCGGVMEFLGSTTVTGICKATFVCDECGESIVNNISQHVHAA